MALHCKQDGDDVSSWYGWSVLVLGPPLIEGLVGVDVEALFWWWCPSKCIGDVGAVDW
jgi:hypothetical protein